MLSRSVLLALAFSFVLSSIAQAGPTKAEALAGIEAIERDPISERAIAAFPLVVKFAQESPEVSITISEKILPWIGTKDYGPLLLGAYVAGNVKAQLERGAPEDRPYEGLKRVFAVYAAMKKRKPGLIIEGIEKQIDQDTKGELQAEVGKPGK